MKSPIRPHLLLLVVSAAGIGAWAVFLRPAGETLSAPEEQLQQAIAAIESGDLPVAADRLDAVLQLDPEQPLALLYRGQLHAEEGRPLEALRLWSKVPDTPQQFGATARFLEGATLLQSGRAREAEQKLIRSRTLNPNYTQPRERLIQLYASELRGEETRRELLSIQPLRTWTMDEAALFLLAGRPAAGEPDAIRVLEQRVDNDANDLRSLVALAHYDLNGGRSDEALERLETRRGTGSEDEGFAGVLALALLAEQRIGDAATILSERSLTQSSPAILWRAYGQFCCDTGEWESAIHSLSHVATRDPFDPEVHFLLATALQSHDETGLASEVFDTITRLDRLERLAYKVLGATERSPQLLVPTLLQIHELLSRLGHRDTAEFWREEALRRASGDPELLAACRRSFDQVDAARGQPLQLPDDVVAINTSSTAGIARPSAESLNVGQYENASGEIRFEDVAEIEGLEFAYFTGNSGLKWIIETIGGGVSVLDYDRDGCPDLYFPQGCPLPFADDPHLYLDRLFRREPGSGFVDVTAAAGLGDDGYSQGCAVGDIDNDGFPDLLVCNVGHNVLYRNNGDGTFSESTPIAVAAAGDASASAAFGDFDGDGLPDLYVANYVEDWTKVCPNRQGDPGTCDPQSFPAAQDRLFQNAGDGTFAEVTEAGGIVEPGGKGLGVVVLDLDGDGMLDVYVANDGTPNFLFRNESRPGSIRFSNIGYPSGTAVNRDGRSEAGMGVACADFDGNGELDLHVTNFYHESNTLYLNDGGGAFHDASLPFRLVVPSRMMLGFGTQAADFDLDGDPDLFVANGHIDDYSWFGLPWKMRPQLFRNDRGRRFEDASADCGPYFLDEFLGRGAARLDYNRDGLPDLVVVHQDRPAALLANTTSPAGKSLVLQLHGTWSSRDAVGAEITCVAGGLTQVAALTGGDGYQAANERVVFFGLGSAEVVDSLEIRWPGGHRDRWTGIAAGHRWLLTEGRPPVPDAT